MIFHFYGFIVFLLLDQQDKIKNNIKEDDSLETMGFPCFKKADDNLEWIH